MRNVRHDLQDCSVATIRLTTADKGVDIPVMT